MIFTCGVPALSIVTAAVLLQLQGATTLRLVDLKVPRFTVRGKPVRLECHYDLEGEALYSVKWFKNNQEFFRFLPEDDPPAQGFYLRGVYVDLPNSSDTAVVLRGVDVQSTGDYRCEVSCEAPSFKTVIANNTMIVVDIPDASGPEIDGVRSRYQIGELVRANCTSPRSRPAAQLSWYINHKPAEEQFLQYHPTIVDEDGLQTSNLGLEFRIRRQHLEHGDLKLKCIAKIDTIYWRTNEQSVKTNRVHKSPMLDNQESFPPGTSSGAAPLKSNLILPRASNCHVIFIIVCFLYPNFFSSFQEAVFWDK